jgi:hypothetical protein
MRLRGRGRRRKSVAGDPFGQWLHDFNMDHWNTNGPITRLDLTKNDGYGLGLTTTGGPVVA